MRKALGVVVGVAVVVAVAWTGAAWYTGKRVETVVRQRVDESNAQLQDLLPAGQASLAIQVLDRHVFSTDVLLVAKLRTGAPGQPPGEDSFEMGVHIDHGPFPWSQVKHGHLAPAMAAASFALHESDSVKPWFSATKGAAPLSGHAAISYAQAVTGTMELAPAQLDGDGKSLAFSGMSIDFSQDADKHSRVDGAFERLSFKHNDAELPIQIELEGASLTSDMRPGPADLQLGNTRVTLKRVAFIAAGRAPVEMTGYEQRTEAKEDQGRLSLHGAYDVAMLNVGGRDIGSVQLGVGASNLEPQAIKSLASLYGKLWSQGMEQAQSGKVAGQPELTPEDRAQALAARQALLAANPSFSIDPILLKTSNGEARFNLTVDLSDPGQDELPLNERIARTLRRLDARASVAQPLLAALLSQSMQRDGMEAAPADAQAQALAGILAKAAADSGYATVQGNDIVSTLKYADRTVDLNGTKMPLEQFAGLILQAAMGMMGQAVPGMELPEGIDPDEATPDDAAPDESVPDEASPDPASEGGVRRQ